MRTVVVSISDMQVSAEADTELMTFALGSCIGVTVWDPVRKAGGLIHFLLPLSTATPEKAQERPAMFADSGVPLLFHSMYQLGCQKRDLVVTVTGGASINGDSTLFNVGKRNYVTLRKMFWQNEILIAAESVGGNISRTVRLDVGTGVVRLRMSGKESVLWQPLPAAASPGRVG